MKELLAYLIVLALNSLIIFLLWDNVAVLLDFPAKDISYLQAMIAYMFFNTLVNSRIHVTNPS